MKCFQCGACCREMNSPPFIGPDDPDMLALPAEVRADYDRGMQGREFTGWPDGVPCFWLTDEGTCRHYAHRPSICREFVSRSSACDSWRAQVEAETA